MWPVFTVLSRLSNLTLLIEQLANLLN
uniref:Uncharacterized protein n=1 Tax=Rhizophora mucronata TaxID=61149 RepID=A0A2P2P6G9_RHIMU